ncbi:uncharacterized protein LOC9639367 [Selaginella moellendorffii]|uniref:uncharacterized protein LOC9639367 n=1 Tax=Selaginella moellendorffii TaxID=88036 RepID=UPI000D1CE7CF|nr:uncharacterized protein LOC9639367 [Selaginella moellendorffii]|eukprot:XP_002977620.2 uncharacterized protein LOC9639367 [Selaginella moellendorffii]
MAAAVTASYRWRSVCSRSPTPSSRASASLAPRFLRRALLGAAAAAAGIMEPQGGDPAFAARSKKRSEAEEILRNVVWPEEFPFKKEDFQRYDESPDTLFYSTPRFVTHIDDAAIQALTKYYATVFPPSNTPGVALLDMCSSWVSHYPKNYAQQRIAGQGLNEEELKRNPVLTEYLVQDLNQNPRLPYEDNSFDVITNTVSVDYLSKPIDVFKEMNRVLKPGGLACLSFSNRCFWTKAVSVWTATGDVDHVWIVGAYFHYAGRYEPAEALDISPNPGRTDPMYVVFSRKVRA